ncbi:uncharacterized protein [Temnothorax nylanderi]|uniref:uncharacterized protein n=1 Tax=Temnothorax nylanderi TaxID=102681 RepID=UPI003A8C0372
MEDDKSLMNTAVINTLKDNINISCLSPIKVHNKTDIQIKKTIKAQKENELLINKVKKDKLIKNINDFACEDETFYLPAEQAANINNDMDNFNLDDTENKPPKKKRWSKRKDIPKQLNMRYKANRAKLNGQDCWKCREYYKMLSLSKEEIQKRKNQCSRHRHKYERPNTPEDDCREERKRFENFILQKVNELLEVVRRNDNPVERTDRHYALLPQMPFNDINELQRFDRDLKDNGQMRDQFMKKIQDIGGKSVQKAVKYAMEVVMTDDLTQQVVWTLGAENKPKISKFTFPYVIIDVVRNTFEGTKIKAVEDRIAEWLRRGGDRKKAENKRRERQNLQQ